ncbi:uncharacterized protein LOC126843638 [Adelges cooleyi]|uniref:uncharacterized protein LOC126843638 n=1 Tax=Adelges cooleyi TaxID=133065 RepID=UPI00217F5DAE|nr:uncharacterized protein LOC126843638 [Adelges cooleyi]
MHKSHQVRDLDKSQLRQMHKPMINELILIPYYVPYYLSQAILSIPPGQGFGQVPQGQTYGQGLQNMSSYYPQQGGASNLSSYPTQGLTMPLYQSQGGVSNMSPFSQKAQIMSLYPSQGGASNMSPFPQQGQQIQAYGQIPPGQGFGQGGVSYQQIVPYQQGGASIESSGAIVPQGQGFGQIIPQGQAYGQGQQILPNGQVSQIAPFCQQGPPIYPQQPPNSMPRKQPPNSMPHEQRVDIEIECEYSSSESDDSDEEHHGHLIPDTRYDPHLKIREIYNPNLKLWVPYNKKNLADCQKGGDQEKVYWDAKCNKVIVNDHTATSHH